MIGYLIKINSTIIYRVDITRLDELTTINKYNAYRFSLFDECGILRYMGQVKHKYLDGIFILMNKVNKEIHKWMKDRLEFKMHTKGRFDLIKHSQELTNKIEIVNDVKRKRDEEANKLVEWQEENKNYLKSHLIRNYKK
jgi:hypothetical protein